MKNESSVPIGVKDSSGDARMNGKGWGVTMKGRMIWGGVVGFAAGFLGGFFFPLLLVGGLVMVLVGLAFLMEMAHSKSPTKGRGDEPLFVGDGIFLGRGSGVSGTRSGGWLRHASMS